MIADFEPAYIKAHQSGLLGKKVRAATSMLQSCAFCPRKCKVNRLVDETGVCRTGRLARVSSYNPHFGEEAPLVGSRGSGTIFFTHCNLLCLFCQNFDISHEGYGQAVSNEDLAGMMLALQKRGCHNINFVTPSHVVPQILGAVEIAVQQGLAVPLIYNTGGYDRLQTLKLLENVFDIYMPDFKFWDPLIAEQACNARDYPAVARTALKEMYRQVGDLVMDEAGIAQRGVLIRHLVLPHGLAGTREIMRFIAREISHHSYVNIMTQYRPCGRAAEIKGLDEYPSRRDFESARQAAREEGITRLDRARRVFILH